MSSTLRSLIVLTAAAGSLAAPAAHAEAEIFWKTCGVTTTINPLGNSNAYAGEMHAGPAAVADVTGPANPVTLVCEIQMNSDTVGQGTTLASAYSAPGIGAATLAPTSYNFIAVGVDDLFVCSGIWFKLPDGTWVHRFDDKNLVKAGTQCELISIAVI